MKANTLHEAQRPLFKQLVTTAVEVRKYTEDKKLPAENRLARGAGVILSSSGLILTAYHFIRRCRVVRVRRLRLDTKYWRLHVYGSYKADIIYRDTRADIALLKLRKPPSDLVATTIGDIDIPPIGEPLFRVGRDDVPLAAGWYYQLGEHMHRRIKLMSVSMLVGPGSSGGPIHDDKGRLIGICLYRQATELYPPAAYVLPFSAVASRILRQKEVRDQLVEWKTPH